MNKHLVKSLSLLVLVFIMAGCFGSSGGIGVSLSIGGGTGWENEAGGDLLLSVDDLKKIIDGGAFNIVLIDCRGSVADFDSGHIPNAIWIDSEDILPEPPTPFPSVAFIENYLGNRGIKETDTIVLYGAGGFQNQSVTRLFWLLEYLGCRDVHIINGGLQQWLAQGYGLDGTPWAVIQAGIIPKIFAAQLLNAILARKDHIEIFLDNLENSNTVVIDGRTPWEFTGEAAVQVQDRAGRIPHSGRLWWQESVDRATGLLRTPGEVKNLFDQSGFVPGNNVIAAATSSSRASVIFFLCRLLDYPCKLYRAGIYEWSDIDKPAPPLLETTQPFLHKSALALDGHAGFGGASAVYGNQIFIFGGIKYSEASGKYKVGDGIWGFDTSVDPVHEGSDIDCWKNPSNKLLQPMYGMSAALDPAGDAVYLFGGCNDGGTIHDRIIRCDINPVTLKITAVTVLGLHIPKPLYLSTCSYNQADGKIYLFGGRTGFEASTSSSSAYVFTPLSMGGPLIAEVSQLPSARAMCGGAAVQGNIYCLGGESDTGTLLDEVLEYDPLTDVWTPRDPMLNPRSGVKGAVVSDRIYMCGGFIEDPVAGMTTTGLVESYDPVIPGEVWEQEGDMGIPRHSYFSGAVDGSVYLIGGYDGSPDWHNGASNEVRFSNAVEYRPVRIETNIPLTFAGSSGSTVVINNKFYLFGGYKDGKLIDDTVRYNPVLHDWVNMDPVPTGPIMETSTARLGDNTAVLVGGSGLATGTGVASAYRFVPYKPSGSQWEVLTDMPEERYGASAVYYHDGSGYLASLGVGADLVIVTGGMDPFANLLRTTLIYDLAAANWIYFEPLPDGRGGATVVCFDSKIILMGGVTTDARPLAETLMLDLANPPWQWVNRGSMPTARYGQGGALIGNLFYNVGGFVLDQGQRAVTDAVEAFDLSNGSWIKLPGIGKGRAMTFTGTALNAQLEDVIYIIGGYAEDPWGIPQTTYFDDMIRYRP